MTLVASDQARGRPATYTETSSGDALCLRYAILGRKKGYEIYSDLCAMQQKESVSPSGERTIALVSL